MSATSRYMIAIAALTLVMVSRASGQPLLDDTGSSPTAAASSGQDTGRDDGRFGIHFQAGAFTRLTTNIQYEGVSNYLVTADLVGLKWSRTVSTFGLGLHFTFDENGHRLGIKGLWRTPLTRGRAQYLQFAPGVYVSSTGDNYTFSKPGYFFEAELGLVKYFAIVAALEVLPMGEQEVGWDHDTWEPIYGEGGTATSTYLGAKVGQWPGAVATLVGVVVAGVVVASSMDGFME